MRLKHFLLLFLFFSSSFIFSQSNEHDLWIIDFNENLNSPLTSQELVLISNAFDNEAIKRIKKIKALEKNIKDILRNRVKILTKKFNVEEELPKLSTITNQNSPKIFNKINFNPFLYDFDFESIESQIYRVDGTDFIINIIPKKLK
tara:strand:+ start:708 stop:1145 length:438 start_codon:yes stop_codon:yes gene_type:complete